MEPIPSCSTSFENDIPMSIPEDSKVETGLSSGEDCVVRELNKLLVSSNDLLQKTQDKIDELKSSCYQLDTILYHPAIPETNVAKMRLATIAMRRSCVEMSKEVNKLRKQIMNIEEVKEEEDRKSRKFNVVIHEVTSRQETRSDEESKRKAEEIFEKSLGLHVTVEWAKQLKSSKPRLISTQVRFATLEDKMNVLENSRKLKGKKIAITHDPTERELKVSQQIKEAQQMAKEERMKLMKRWFGKSLYK